MKDYDLKIRYHLEKTNVVTDVLSRNSAGLIALLMVREWSLLDNWPKWMLNSE